jgi:glutaredoxin 3
MEKLSGGQRTVPQIFINDVHVGGYTDLARKDAMGELDDMLGRGDASA